MAQTTGGGTFRKANVDVSPDGVTWTDISGQGAGIATGGGTRAHGAQHTYEGDIPIVKSGKRAEKTVTCRFVYSEIAAEAFEVCRAMYETPGGEAWLRYFPFDDDDGNFIYETGQGIMTDFLYPEGEPGPGVVIMGEITIVCASISKDVAIGGS
jgi:hypothetical protein